MTQVDDLCTLLGEETRICGELAGVLRAEQEAVVGLSPEAILSCLEQRQALQEELVHLAADRKACVRRVASAHGAAADRVTDLLPLLPPAPRAEVRGRLRGLRGALLQARGLERQNAQLVGAGLDTVDELLRTLRALVPGARYGADARVEAPTALDRLDRRV